MKNDELSEVTQKARSPAKVLRHAFLGAVILLACCLAFTMPAAAWTANTSWYDTDLGADEYTIYTADELAGLAVIVNTEDQFYGKTIKLGADINLENQEWTPIGIWDTSTDYPECFSGTFDGQGHTISNLYISNQDLDYTGLFGWVNSQSSISNLTLRNVNVSGSESGDVGALAGFVDGKVTVGDEEYNSYITSCSVIGGTVSSKSDGSSCVGGLIGSTRFGPVISRCYAEVTVTGNYAVGGIVGNHNQEADMSYCSAKCTITDGSDVGGLVGHAGGISNIFASSAYCEIQGGSTIGGIVGRIYGGNISDCFVNLDITSTGSLSYTGGVVGNTYYETNITNCYATGALVVTNPYALPYTENNGGLVGFSGDFVNIINSVSLMQYVYGSTSTGRLAGTEDINVVNSYAWEGMKNNDSLFIEGGLNGTSVSSSQVWNSQSFFADSLGWDFTNIWKMNSGNDNYQLPVLQYQVTPVSGDASYLASSVDPGEPDDPVYLEDIEISESDVGYIGNDITISGTAQPSSSIFFYLKDQAEHIPFHQVKDEDGPLTAVTDSDGNWAVTISGSELYDESLLPMSSANYEVYLTYLSSADSGSAILETDSNSRVFAFSTNSPELYVSDISDVMQGGSIVTSGRASGAESIIYYIFSQNGVTFDEVQLDASGDYTITIPTTPETFSAGQYWMVIQHPMYDGVFNINPELNSSAENSVDIVLDYPAGNLTTPGVLFNVPTVSGKYAVDALDYAISELKWMDACEVIPFNVTLDPSTISLSINVYDNVMTQGESLEVYGVTNFPTGTNLTFTISYLDEAGEVVVVDGCHLHVQEGSSGINTWNVTYDTTSLLGEYYLIIFLTENLDIYAGPISVIVEEKIPEPARIVISPETVTINVTESVTFTATVYDEEGKVIEDSEVSWVTNLPMQGEGGIIDQNGKFTATEDASGDISVMVYPKGYGIINATAVVTVIPLHASSIKLTGPVSALEMNEEFIFTADVKDQFGNPFDAYVEWWVDNESVGTVEKDGTFTAKEIGMVNVTAGVDLTGGADYITSTFPVSVVAAVPAEIVLNPTSAVLNCTETVEFTATVKDKRGNVLSDAPVTWSVDTEEFGTITSGVFTAVSSLIEEDGTVIVTASPTDNSNVRATATVEVIGFHATEILLTPPDSALEVGDEANLRAVVKDQFGNLLEIPVSWVSSNTDVGTIDENGNFTAVKAGESVITASAGSASETAVVSVVNVIPRAITLDKESAVINATESVTFTAEVLDKNGKVISNAPVLWSLDNEAAGSIENGVFIADKAASGTVNITAKAKDNQSVMTSARVSIEELRAESIEMSVSSASLEVNETFAFEADVKDQLGNPFSIDVIWTSDNESVGVFEDNIFTARGIGTANITASAGDVSITQPVEVVAAVPYEIQIEPVNTVLNYTESVQLNVTIKDRRGIQIASPYDWVLDTEEFGTLDNGIFTASEKLIEQNGLVTVTVTPEANQTIHANATISVNGFFAKEIGITNKTSGSEVTVVELNPNEIYAFNATVNDQNGNAFPEGYANLNWTSSKTAIGTISTSGVFTALDIVGETTVTAKSGNVSQTVLIKVFKEVTPEVSVTAKVEDGAVNMTLPDETASVKVTVNDTENKTEIKDTENNVVLVVSFETMTNTSTHVEGNVSSIEAKYEERPASSAEGVGVVNFSLNLNLKNITSLPSVKPVINETKKSLIGEKKSNHVVGAMVEVDSSINSNLTAAELVFFIPKAWVSDSSKLKVFHVTDTSVSEVTSKSVVDNKDGTWKVTVTVTKFSAYAVAKDTTPDNPYVPPYTPGGDSPSPQPTVIPQVTPTEEPTVEPTVEPTTVPVVPTEPGKSPVPVAGLVFGALVAAAVLRRK